MTFAHLATGDTLFLDANTLIHLFEPHPQWGALCQQLIQRIDNQDLVGFTSTHVVSEVCHRLMTVAAHRAMRRYVSCFACLTVSVPISASSHSAYFFSSGRGVVGGSFCPAFGLARRR